MSELEQLEKLASGSETSNANVPRSLFTKINRNSLNACLECFRRRVVLIYLLVPCEVHTESSGFI